MPKIRLRVVEDVTGRELGNLLIDPDCIESVEDWDLSHKPCSTITMKAVTHGFHGNSDILYRLQNQYRVKESVVEIERLIEEAKVKDL